MYIKVSGAAAVWEENWRVPKSSDGPTNYREQETEQMGAPAETQTSPDWN